MTTTNNRLPKADWAKLREDFDDTPGSFFVAIVILAVLGSLFLKVIAINIAPYLIVMGEPVPPASGVPIVGWLWDVLTLLYFNTGAFIAWSLLLVMETMWIGIYLDRKAHRAAVRQSQDEQAYQATAPTNAATDRSADRYTRKMQRRAVRLPFFFIAAAGWIALIAYGLEAVIQFKAYPPISSWSDFLAGMTIGDMSPVDFGNILKAAWGMVGTEIFVAAILIVITWIRMHQAGSNP
jgi:hypothetical protein